MITVTDFMGNPITHGSENVKGTRRRSAKAGHGEAVGNAESTQVNR